MEIEMLKQIRKTAESEKQKIMPGKAINSPFPTAEVEQVDPFVLLHHFGPFEVNRSNSFSFEPHPHRGFEAVTFVFEGEFEHRDSSGGYGRLSRGDVQWMTAGSGIIHEEKQPDDFIKKGGVVHGIQLWINLPKVVKMTSPKYQDIRSSAIPVLEENNSRLRVIAGKYKNLTGPANTFTTLLVINGLMDNNSKIELEVPENQNTLLYITGGQLNVNGTLLIKTQMALFETKGNVLKLDSEQGAEFMLLSGEPINEPIVQYGPFVMNSMGEIKQAYLDYSKGLMGKM